MNSDGDESDVMDGSEDDDNFDHYYDGNGDDIDMDKGETQDPEYFEFQLLHIEDVELLLNEIVATLCTTINVVPSLAKLLLHSHRWAIDEIVHRYSRNPNHLLIESHILPKVKTRSRTSHSNTCEVCLVEWSRDAMRLLSCGHQFCHDCWDKYLQIQIRQGLSIEIKCMGQDCNVLVPEDFALNVLTGPELRNRYEELAFRAHVQSHPGLRYCPGPNCPMVVRAKEPVAKRVTCSQCNSVFCFKCGNDYHAPTQCDIIKKWLTKCADDSETANYISAHTKDCPKCHVCIEKNGGCNHMQCSKCKHDFCWMCLDDWKKHGSEYYECSRYKENPNIANESDHAKAREALKKYLFYFERWENHAKSLQLEVQMLCKIRERTQEKVMNNAGTWIDWQYLLDASKLLRKCRYTLQYTYPYAYFLAKGSKKELFEYQQAQLEAEVENLSWKVERAEITDRGDLENQMDIAEKRRLTLIIGFVS